MKIKSLIIFFLISGLFSLRASDGVEYYKSGFPNLAKTILLNELMTDSASKSTSCFYLGNIYFEEGKIDSAGIYFNKGLNALPHTSYNAIGLAMIKMKTDAKSANEDIKSILKLKENRRNIDIMMAVSRAYLMDKDFENANKYANEARNINSKDAQVYVLIGDIKLAQSDVGGACSSYETAIYFNDNCREAYIKYARAYKGINSSLAINMLQKLREKQPDFLLADKELADLYYTTDDFDKSAELYKIYIKTGNTTVQDLMQYALILFLDKKFDESLDVVKLGLEKDPTNPAFNRLAMWNNVDLHHDDEALKAADVFFNHSKNPEFTYLDYRYYGQALRDTKQYDKAIEQYQKALKMDSTKIELFKDISDMYNDISNYPGAINAYSQYESKLKPDQVTPDVIIALGKLYYSYGNDKNTSPADQKVALTKADSVFAKVAELEPDNYRGNFWRARTNSALDPETTQGLAKPFYEKTVQVVEPKNDPRYNPVLVECYSYLGYYSLLKEDYQLSLSYWNKILAIDPANSTAQKAIAGIQKTLKGKK